MGLKIKILNIILGFCNLFIRHIPLKERQVAFVSLEGKQLDDDMLLIYNAIKDRKDICIQRVLIAYDKKTVWNNFLYMLNCIKQIYVINTSKVVIIRDNNYVISRFKRQGVKVIQVWHACGAIKKFGNAIKREYPIANYDYVISNSDYWKIPYSQAFAVKEDQVITTGMPRVDHLFDDNYKMQTKKTMMERYPQLQGKTIYLYAPTFRGNIYQGFSNIDFNAEQFMAGLDDNAVLLYKFHPLIKEQIDTQDQRIYNMNHENIHDLMVICDVFISDFSSIIFDFSILNKPMYFYVPDLEDYIQSLGCFVDYKMMPGAICYNMKQLLAAIRDNKDYPVQQFANTFFVYQDGKNTKRVVSLIDSLLQNKAES